MKYIISTFILFAALQFSYSQSNHEVRVQFTHDMTNDDLTTIQSRMSAMGYHFEFPKAEFDSAGKLISLKVTVETNEGFKGSGNSKDLRNQVITYTHLKDGSDKITVEKLAANKQ